MGNKMVCVYYSIMVPIPSKPTGMSGPAYKGDVGVIHLLLD